MIGGTHNNAVSGLAGLVEIDDPRVVDTFHTYEPRGLLRRVRRGGLGGPRKPTRVAILRGE